VKKLRLKQRRKQDGSDKKMKLSGGKARNYELPL